MLKGFHYPLSPQGKSSLNLPPPWYYSSDVLSIEFWASPEAVKALLPEGLTSDAASEGRCTAWFYDWQFSGENEEYLEPARYQYREFFVLLDASFEGVPVSYCPYIFVDNDAAFARGWSQGYPKRLGEIFQTRYYAATGKAGPKLAAGSKFAGTMASAGQRLAKGVVTLEESVTDASALKMRPIVNLLYTPRLAKERQAAPEICELVKNVPHDLSLEQIWVGKGELSLPVSEGEDMSDLAPVRCGMGWRASMAYVVDDLITLKQLKAEPEVVALTR